MERLAAELRDSTVSASEQDEPTDESDTDSLSSDDDYSRSLLVSTTPRRGSDLYSTTKGSGSCCSGGFKWRVRYIKSRSAYLVLLWNLLVFSYQYALLNSLLNFIPFLQEQPLWHTQFALAMFQVGVPLLFYPIAGWIADTKFGRYRVMRISIWIMWVGGVLLVIASILHYKFAHDHPKQFNAIVLPVGVVVYLISTIGLAGFHVNIIPFGIDQMKDGSAAEYSSFIHWYYWTRNFSLGLIVQVALYSLSRYCSGSSSEYSDRIDLIVLIVEMLFLTLAICLDFIFSDWLVKEPMTQNPFKMVRKISAFVIKHNQPVGRRKAVTYTWGSSLPSRTDLAKKKFGGPFEDEDVESVKTFWHIVVFLLSLGGFVIMNEAGIYTFTLFASHTWASGIHCTGRSLIENGVYPLAIVISVPLHEFLIYPLLRHQLLPMLYRMGIGIVLTLLGIICLFAMDLIGHLHSSHQKLECLLYSNASQQENFEIVVDPRVMILPIALVAVGEMQVVVSGYEFISAQSPYNMRGLLLGIFYTVYGVYDVVVAILLLAFSEAYKDRQLQPKGMFSCGSIFYLVIIVLGSVGSVFFLLAACWYKERQRGGQILVNERAILESYFEQSTALNRH